MAWLDKAIDSIAKHEGFSPVVYQCTAGYDTIGYGKRVKYIKVTQEVGREWLGEDAETLKYVLADKYDWFLSATDEVKGIVLEMNYQLGVSAFSKFKKTIKYIKVKDYKSASTEMLDSKWARDDTPRRAKELSDRMKNIG